MTVVMLNLPPPFSFFWAVPFSRLSFGSPAPGAELAVKMNPELPQELRCARPDVLLAGQSQILLCLGRAPGGIHNQRHSWECPERDFGVQGVEHRSLRGSGLCLQAVNQHQRLWNSLGRQTLELVLVQCGWVLI